MKVFFTFLPSLCMALADPAVIWPKDITTVLSSKPTPSNWAGRELAHKGYGIGVHNPRLQMHHECWDVELFRLIWFAKTQWFFMVSFPSNWTWFDFTTSFHGAAAWHVPLPHWHPILRCQKVMKKIPSPVSTVLMRHCWQFWHFINIYKPVAHKYTYKSYNLYFHDVLAPGTFRGNSSSAALSKCTLALDPRTNRGFATVETKTNFGKPRATYSIYSCFDCFETFFTHRLILNTFVSLAKG